MNSELLTAALDSTLFIMVLLACTVFAPTCKISAFLFGNEVPATCGARLTYSRLGWLKFWFGSQGISPSPPIAYSSRTIYRKIRGYREHISCWNFVIKQSHLQSPFLL